MAGKRRQFARVRKTAGYTQEGLAEYLGVDRSTVGRWEIGEVEPQAGQRPKIATALGVSLDQLAGLLAAGEDSEQLDVTGRVRSSSLPAAWPVLTVDDLPHLTAALDDTRHYFDGEIISVLRRQLDAAKADDGQRGPAAALSPVLTVLGAVQSCIGEVQPAVRSALLSVGADGAEFVGWLYRDLHDLRTATYWYDRAIEWAHEANDPAMQGYVLLRKSQLAYDRRDPLRVLTLAEAAQRSTTLPVRVRAEVTQQEALGLAMTGEPLDAVEKKLDAARQLLSHTTPDDAGLLGDGFTEGTLQLRSTACYTEAGKPGRAATILASIIADGGLSPRDAGYFQARRAAALALIGEPDEAARLGVAAAQVAHVTRSGRTTTVLTDTMQTLARWRTRPPVRELHEALTTTRTA